MNERASHTQRAIGYIRCSVSVGACGLESIGVQMSSLERFCARNGYRLGGYLVDLGAPAELPGTQLLSLLPAAARPKQFDIVVACSASRIARDAATLEDICSRFETAAVQLVTIEDRVLAEGAPSQATFYNVQEGRHP